MKKNPILWEEIALKKKLMETKKYSETYSKVPPSQEKTLVTEHPSKINTDTAVRSTAWKANSERTPRARRKKKKTDVIMRKKCTQHQLTPPQIIKTQTNFIL